MKLKNKRTIFFERNKEKSNNFNNHSKILSKLSLNKCLG